MPKPRRQFVDTEYGQMHVRVSTPEAPPSHYPLICLHMSPKSGRFFVDFMTAASTDRIVVAPDYPGYGESDHPPADPHVRVEDYARAVWQALDALGLDKVDLFGHHTGSQVAGEMAQQRPDNTGNIVMVSALVLSKEEREQFDNHYQPVPLDEDGTRFKKMWEAINTHRGPGVTLEMMAMSLGESMRGGDNYEWGHRAAFVHSESFPDVLAALPHKVTVLNPKDDLFELTPRVGALLQNGEVIDKPGWGHGFLDAFTDEAVRDVKAALD